MAPELEGRTHKTVGFWIPRYKPIHHISMALGPYAKPSAPRNALGEPFTQSTILTTLNPKPSALNPINPINPKP